MNGKTLDAFELIRRLAKPLAEIVSQPKSRVSLGPALYVSALNALEEHEKFEQEAKREPIIHDVRPHLRLDLPLTEPEKQVLYVLEGEPMRKKLAKPGGFVTSLIDTMCHADPENAFRLSLVYPGLMGAVLDYKFGNLHNRAEAQLTRKAR